jgi:toxin ParE1/3/4
MPKKYTVYWTNVAKTDLYNIIKYIAMDNFTVSKKHLSKLRKDGDKLKSYPSRGRIVPELEKNNICNYREIISSPWRIIYKIVNFEVYIVAVIDGRRNLEDLLLERLLSQK